MRATWIVLATGAVLLTACQSTPDAEQTPATVEDRNTTGGTSGAQTQPLKPQGIAKVDITGTGKTAARAPHNDPSSPLSKRSIYYDLDQFDVKGEYRDLVETHAKYLRANPGLKMLVQGNTDERGSREYNVGLGQRRSDGVKRMMLLLGVREDQIESVSLGEEKPKAEGQGEAAWSQNRRSDILYSGEF